MKDTHFFYQQANWCYQLAWQCFDLTAAHKLNVMGNDLAAKAREFGSGECERGTPGAAFPGAGFATLTNATAPPRHRLTSIN